MSGDAIAVEFCQRGSHPRGLTKTARVSRRQHETRIAGLTELVHLDEPGFELRPGRGLLLLQRRHPFRHGGQLVLDSSCFGVELAQFFDFDLTLDFELAKIAEQRPFLGGQLVGFAVQRGHARGGASGERFGTGAVGSRTGGG